MLQILFFTLFGILCDPSHGQETLLDVAKPLNYDVYFDLGDTQSTKEFSGVTQIEFECMKQSSTLYLHCKNLELLDTRTSISGDLDVESIVIQNDTEICEIQLSGDMQPGVKYTIDIGYNGKINSEPHGIFQETYRNNIYYIVTTNFKQGHARSAFPCFDDPKYKATFTVSVKHQWFYYTIGSTPVFNVTKENQYTKTVFETTPQPINADVISFTIHQSLQQSSVPNPLFETNIYHLANQNVTATLATIGLMQGIHTTFFGLSRININNFIAAPTGTKLERIDNWGSHYVDESVFLRSVLTSLPPKYQETLLMYSHQFCLNWLEYEMTPNSWDEWWISRGLAKFYEYYIPANTPLLNKWIDWNQFVLEVTQKSLEQEESVEDDSHPIEGLRSNERAASIFNMMQNVMEQDNFDKSVKSFVKSFSGLTMTSQDLYNEVVKNVPELLPADIGDIFAPWFKINGYPLIRVTRKDSTVTLKQEIFKPTKSSKADTSLYIPINYVTGAVNDELDFEDTAISDWILPDSELKIENIPAKDFIIFNKQQTGYYRVLYDDLSYNLLTNLLLVDHTNIHPINRAQLIDDASSFARHGFIEYSTLFNLLEYIGTKEDNYAVWYVVNKEINFLLHKLRSSDGFGRFETFVRELTKKHFDELGLGTDLDLSEGSTIQDLLHHQRLNRQYVAELACFTGVETCVNETMEYVEKLMQGEYSIVLPEVIPTMACVVFKYDYKILDRLLEYIKKPSSSMSVEEKGIDLLAKVQLPPVLFDLIVESIGCSRNESSLETTLDLSIIPANKISGLISRATRRKLFETVVKGNHYGTKLALEFMKEHYLAMNQRYDDLSLVFKAFDGYILTEELLEMYKEVVQIYEAKFYPETVRTAAYATLTASEKEVKWTKTYVDMIEEWLRENDFNGTTTEKPPGAGSRHVLNISILIVLLLCSLIFNLQ